jgi:hypothetical protein
MTSAMLGDQYLAVKGVRLSMLQSTWCSSTRIAVAFQRWQRSRCRELCVIEARVDSWERAQPLSKRTKKSSTWRVFESIATGSVRGPKVRQLVVVEPSQARTTGSPLMAKGTIWNKEN